MKFFEKTLDEIVEIITKINDELWPDGGQELMGLSFEFNDWVGIFKFNEMDLINSENDEEWHFSEELNEYEDIEITLRRLIKNLYTNDIANRVSKL